MVNIPIGKTGKFCLLDEESALLLRGKTLSANPYPGFYYYKGNTRKKMLVHRFLLNAQDGEIVDHINGNPLDNRLCNIRITTQKVNCINRRKAVGKSRFKGVFFDSRKSPLKKPWRAAVWPNNEVRYLGYFLDEESAARAYDAGAREAYGAYAVLNFPEGATE